MNNITLTNDVLLKAAVTKLTAIEKNLYDIQKRTEHVRHICDVELTGYAKEVVEGKTHSVLESTKHAQNGISMIEAVISGENNYLMTCGEILLSQLADGCQHSRQAMYEAGMFDGYTLRQLYDTVVMLKTVGLIRGNKQYGDEFLSLVNE